MQSHCIHVFNLIFYHAEVVFSIQRKVRGAMRLVVQSGDGYSSICLLGIED